MYCPNPECPDFKQTGTPGEYVKGVTECPFCGALLVEEMPEQDEEAGPGGAGHAHEELAAIASYNYRQDAELAMTYLMNHGIDVFESPDDCGGTDPAVGFATRTRLLVPVSQEKRALALLDEAEK